MITEHDQSAKARTFHALHHRDRPLVLFNVWDPGSAQAVEASGAEALATSSWSVAVTHGWRDGETVPLEFVLDNLRRIVQHTTLPVTLDFEAGYAREAVSLGATITQVLDAGAIGCNLEDGIPGSSTLRGIDEQAARLAAARAAAERHGIPMFINARIDTFFVASARERDRGAMIEDVLARGRAYAAAGASGLFVPGLKDPDGIARVVQALALPINVMAGTGTPSLAALTALGVARVSHGSGPYEIAMAALGDAAAKAMSAGSDAG